MSWLRLLAASFGLACLPACDNRPVVDRGSGTCSEEWVSVKVQVLSAEGVLVRGATVTATNEDTRESITGVTNEAGVCRAVNESLAPGPTRLFATAGSKVSQTEEIAWRCGACRCEPVPDAVTLRLNP